MRISPALSFALALLAPVFASCAAPSGTRADGELERFEFAEPHMGTEFRLILYASGPDVASSAARAAFARIAELDARLSDYRADSELSRLGAASDGGPMPAPAPISADLARVLARALEVAAASEGAFDPSVGPFTRLWRRSARQRELPAPARLAEAAAAVGWRFVELDAFAGTARLRARAMRLDLGGIAKGDALDQALAVLAAHGIERALIDGGGDLRAGLPPPGRAGWQVAIEQGGPPLRLELASAALATSGDAYQHVVIDGVRYSHIVDPATGLGLTRPTAASVLASDGIGADALASALCVLGPERGAALAESLPGVEARIVALADDGGLLIRATAGFPRP